MSATTTDLHDEMVGAVRDLTRREVTPCAAALDASDRETFAHCWASACAIGLDRVLLDDKLGGAGLGPAELLAMVEEMAAGDAGLAIAVLLHNVALAALPAEAVAAVADGERWSVALAPQAPPLALGVMTGSARVSGRIPFVPGALGADGVAILAPCLGSAALGLRPTAPGLTIQPDPSQMGWRAAPAATLVLDGVDNAVATPVPHPVGPGAETTRLVRAGVAVVARGIARRAWELALDYAHSRHQGGVPIIEHGAVRDLLAGMAAHLEGVGPVAMSGAWLAGDDGRALAAKVLASDAAVAVTSDAVQVFGGAGYMCETGVEKLMRDAMYCRLYPEPNWLARDQLVGCFERPR
jgi:alkylation response protein AidB-like acyl-CoA dehydrogenase